MPFYQRLGQIPRKHHIWFHRNGAAPTFKNEGIAYEHVITTEGFNEAYSIMYHLRPPTRVRSVKLLKCEELKKAADSPLRHHHMRTTTIPRRAAINRGRIPIILSHPRINRSGAYSEALFESGRPNQNGRAVFGARFSWTERAEHDRQGRGHGNSGQRRSTLDLRDDGASSLRCRRLGRLCLSVY